MKIFNFCNVYISPPNSTVLNHLQVDFIDKLEEDVETYEPLGKVFINGDFNSRTSNFDDYIELDRYVSDDFENNDAITISITRVNQDKKIDVLGKKLLSFCKTCNLLTANGRLHDNKDKRGVHFAK